MRLLVLAALLVAVACGSAARARLRLLARPVSGARGPGPDRRRGGPVPATVGRASAPVRGGRGHGTGPDVRGAGVGPHLRTGAAVSLARPAAPVEVDTVLVLALVEAALTTGTAISTALGAVGRATGGASGAALERAGSALVLGAAWSTAWAGAPPSVRPVRDALESAWTAGAPPVPGLRARADRLRRERRRAVRTAAARLAVHLVLPLGACFLPAFVLVGLVPIVLSLAGGLVLLP